MYLIPCSVYIDKIYIDEFWVLDKNIMTLQLTEAMSDGFTHNLYF